MFSTIEYVYLQLELKRSTIKSLTYSTPEHLVKHVVTNIPADFMIGNVHTGLLRDWNLNIEQGQIQQIVLDGISDSFVSTLSDDKSNGLPHRTFRRKPHW